MTKKRNEPQKVDDIIKSVLNSAGLLSKIKEADIMQKWSDIAGENIAQKAKPIKIHDKKLYLKVESSIWRNELIFHKEKLMEEIEKKAGNRLINDIIFI